MKFDIVYSNHVSDWAMMIQDNIIGSHNIVGKVVWRVFSKGTIKGVI